jgi:hypothetical protein
MSAVPDLQVLIDTAIRANVALMTIAKDVYSNKARDNADFPYIVIGASTENPFPTFGNRGYNGTEQVACYSEHEDKLQAADMYRLVHETFDHKSFTVGTFTIRTRCDLLTLDQDVGGVGRAIAIIRALSRVEQ